jgi:hypothetical protein
MFPLSRKKKRKKEVWRIRWLHQVQFREAVGNSFMLISETPEVAKGLEDFQD